jgi:hypothetical protein
MIVWMVFGNSSGDLKSKIPVAKLAARLFGE